MEAVEDIPGRVIAEGLEYDFETFEEYMDSLSRKKLACDVAVLVVPKRTFSCVYKRKRTFRFITFRKTQRRVYKRS